MSKPSKLSDEARIQAVQEYLDGKGNYKVIANRYGLSPGRLRKLVIRAQIEGIESIRIRNTKKSILVKPRLQLFRNIYMPTAV